MGEYDHVVDLGSRGLDGFTWSSLGHVVFSGSRSHPRSRGHPKVTGSSKALMVQLFC